MYTFFLRPGVIKSTLIASDLLNFLEGLWVKIKL